MIDIMRIKSYDEFVDGIGGIVCKGVKYTSNIQSESGHGKFRSIG
jgi:hypothetical protein